jgi:dihydroneopterin aldolase
MLPHEREREQQISFDLFVVKEGLSVSEDITKTFDYCSLAEICRGAAKKSFLLLESLAEEILETIMVTTSVRSACVTIRKKGAIADAEYAYVTLERKR